MDKDHTVIANADSIRATERAHTKLVSECVEEPYRVHWLRELVKSGQCDETDAIVITHIDALKTENESLRAERDELVDLLRKLDSQIDPVTMPIGLGLILKARQFLAKVK